MMTEQNALQIVDHLITAIQRYRSITREELPDDVLELAETLQPHTMGEEAEFLGVLIKIQDRGTLTTHDFYNLMCMVLIAPEIGVAYAVIEKQSLPEPDLNLLVSGWDEAPLDPELLEALPPEELEEYISE